MKPGSDQISKFNFAYNKLEEIGKLLKEKEDITIFIKKYGYMIYQIKEKNGFSEERIQKLVNNMIEYYDITNNNLIDDLNILFKSHNYYYDINNIISFLDNFKSIESFNNEYYKNKKLLHLNTLLIGKVGVGKSTLINVLLNEIKEKEETIDKFKKIKSKLLEFKEEGIYDYKNKYYCCKFFNSLYNKKEAIDYLFSNDFEDLKN